MDKNGEVEQGEVVVGCGSVRHEDQYSPKLMTGFIEQKSKRESQSDQSR